MASTGNIVGQLHVQSLDCSLSVRGVNVRRGWQAESEETSIKIQRAHGIESGKNLSVKFCKSFPPYTELNHR